MGLGAIGNNDRGEQAAPADEGKPVKKLLRGLLGR
jgi:hypothetical protein